jgi:hypothetical protein
MLFRGRSLGFYIIDSPNSTFFRWISPDSTDVDVGLNLYVYVGNNPLEYIDPTGHGKEILLHLGFVFTCDDGSAAIGVVVFVTESLGFVIQL